MECKPFSAFGFTRCFMHEDICKMLIWYNFRWSCSKSYNNGDLILPPKSTRYCYFILEPFLLFILEKLNQSRNTFVQQKIYACGPQVIRSLLEKQIGLLRIDNPNKNRRLRTIFCYELNCSHAGYLQQCPWPAAAVRLALEFIAWPF